MALTGIRFALGTLSVLPVRVTRWDRDAARAGMVCAPLVGLVVGVFGAAVGGLLVLLGSGPLLTAVAAAAVPAVLTRGLHLDGLADTADGLGSGRPAEDALKIMKQSDIGPFGVLTLLFTLLAQIAALHELYGKGWAYGALGAVVSGVAARLALTLTARTGVPAARPEGLGAAVAEVLSLRAALLVTLLVTAICAAVGAISGSYSYASGPLSAVHFALAVGGGLVAAQLLLRHCVRRFGGVTGDVFGAVAETAATVCLVALVLG
ncbi:adenosylcobinamide-GDP ribazoletransferase [Streptomyces albipurpureus]|uniref:Adenosylcobinamide-GDP ribazoletransferase n=1 Tax=Streptomyces albipurpureus TaxID=2897419 RepID=A0ABT0UR51_9ACTN|nr:adenosylcobinamide-GDP ribazoletransferase [Streptomyces sp. CWNU-1]MCM2391093.1 adenosylcobinamide-GDP ribazoletransferase [Streptomyces sp. CWNU-1]